MVDRGIFLLNFHSSFSFLLALFVVISTVDSGEPDETYRCPGGIPRDTYLKTHRGKCYQFVHEQMYWTSAHDFCRYRTGNLITIRRRDIQTFVEDSLWHLQWGRNGLWIGAHDRDSEMNWKWVTGESVHSGYQNWDSGQPVCWMPFDSMCKEDCACLRLDEGYKWHDYFCAAKGFEYGFVCEYDMVRPRSSTSVLRKTTALGSRMKLPTTATTKRVPTTTTQKVKVTTTVPTYSVNISHGIDVNIVHLSDPKEHEKVKTTSTPTTANNSMMDVYTVINPKVVVSVESARLKTDKGGLQTGSLVGMVVSFVLVFIAGLVVGVFLCKRRERKRYLAANYSASQSVNNVLYTSTPHGQGSRTKDSNVFLVRSESSDEDSYFDDEEHRYVDIDDITPTCCNDSGACASANTAIACKAAILDLPKETAHPDNGDPAVPDDPKPCPGGSEARPRVTRFAVEFLEKDTDVFHAYSNNLYDVVKS